MDDRTVELTIRSDPRCLPIVRSAVSKMAGMEGFDENDSHALMWAIDEALSNVIKHGYDGRSDQPIAISMSPVSSRDGRPGIAVTVRDHGKQVDPCCIKSRNLDDVRPGGLGVHIIQTVMDDYEWSCPPDGGMLLKMIKYISAKTAVEQK
jgi:anti-sigma regulatory factor (Ser/Thr protein kinase)